MRLAVALLMVGALLAQQPLTNDDVLKMLKAGMSEDLLLSMVQQTPGKYAVSPDEVIALKGAGLSDKVIATMVNKGATTSPTEKLSAARSNFRFQRGQSVYVIGMETGSRDLTKTKANLTIERRAKEEFRKNGFFELVSGISQADFVFVVIEDVESAGIEEIGVAILLGDYQQSKRSIDDLRDRALWQDQNRFPRAKAAGAALLTAGLSAIVYHPSVAKGLVSKFHKDCCRP